MVALFIIEVSLQLTFERKFHKHSTSEASGANGIHDRLQDCCFCFVCVHDYCVGVNLCACACRWYRLVCSWIYSLSMQLKLKGCVCSQLQTDVALNAQLLKHATINRRSSWDHLYCMCMPCSAHTSRVTPVQLMRPGIDRNASCAPGDS